jgi:HlyD family secretion protein
MKKILLFLIVPLVAIGVGYRTWYDTAGDRPQFRTLPVARGDLFIGVTATGNVEPVQIIDVGAQIVGMVKSFGPDGNRPGETIDYCSRVKQGDILAQLDDLPHQAELKRATAGLRLAEGELQQARAHQAKAERDFHRAERLRETNSAADYEAATSQFDIAQAELAMCEAKVEQAKSVKKVAEINLDYTTIRSPVNGTVIARRVNVGQTVVAGLNAPSLFLLARDLSRMQVWAAVNEADIGDIHVGQKVTFKVDAYRDRSFTGKVSQIRLDASMVSSVVTYGVVVDVENTDGKLMPYMTAKLQFEVAKRSDVLLVPDQALRWRPTWDQVTPSARAKLPPPLPRKPRPAEEKDGDAEADEPTVETGTPAVWLRADDGLVRPLPVKLGLSDGMVTELTGGDLKIKDEVVINVVRAAKPDFVSSFIKHIVKRSD